MDRDRRRELLSKTAWLEQEVEQSTEALHDIRVIARRGGGEYLVRSSVGCDYVDLTSRTVHRVHEVRALISGGWEAIGDAGPQELEAMQAVTRTLRPYTAATRR